MNEFRKSKQQVEDNGTISIPRADGTFGRRHLSRGLWGFYSPETARAVNPGRRTRRPIDQAVVTEPRTGQFIGFRIVKHG